MKYGLVITALFLPNYTATYEQTPCGEKADINRLIIQTNKDVDQLEQRLERADAIVGSWEASRDLQINTAARAAQLPGDAAAAFLRREKRCLEHGCKRKPVGQLAAKPVLQPRMQGP